MNSERPQHEIRKNNNLSDKTTDFTRAIFDSDLLKAMDFTTREIEICQYRFVDRYTFGQIAVITNLSKERCRMLEVTLLRKMKHRMPKFVEQAVSCRQRVTELEVELKRTADELNGYMPKEVENLPVLAARIQDAQLSPRATNVCHYADIHTVYDLTRLTRPQFAGMRHVGVGTMKEIDEFLTEHGVSWKTIGSQAKVQERTNKKSYTNRKTID